MTHTINLASILLLAAGCAHEEHSMRTDESVSGSYSTPSATGTYSGNPVAGETYSRGNGGNYSTYPAEQRTAPNNPGQSDNTIVAQVRETLSRDPEIAFVVPNIQISANDGAIILSGSVQSEEQKRQILSKVQGIAGVANVNNQLNVMAGPNDHQNSNGSQLNPTSNSGSDRLYKDAADGRDNSTNDVLNPTSNGNGPSQLYHDSSQNQDTNSIAPGQTLNSTSRSDSQNSLYQQDANTQEENISTNSLNPTSRENGSSQIYQNNPGEKSQDQNTNTNNYQLMP